MKKQKTRKKLERGKTIQEKEKFWFIGLLYIMLLVLAILLMVSVEKRGSLKTQLSECQEQILDDFWCEIKICDFYVNRENQPYPCLKITNGHDYDIIDMRFYTLEEQKEFVAQIGWELENCEVIK